MINPRLAIVCGSRRCTAPGREIVWRSLSEIMPGFIIQGGADGVDRAAKEWAEKNGVPCATVAANWDFHGKAAGPIRNGWMLRLNPDVVIAFPGGSGTASMVKRARDAGVKVVEPCKEGQNVKEDRIVCPGCNGIRPTLEESREKGSLGVHLYACCNVKCGGHWGTGCYHCHHPRFWPSKNVGGDGE